MMFNLLENNADVESLIKYLDSIIIKLKNSNKLKNDLDLFNQIHLHYKDTILPWYNKYYINNTEIPKNEEEELCNAILDLITILTKI